MTTSPNSPAFGFSETDYFDDQPIGSTTYPGLTKREYFAALAMQGLLAADAPADAVDLWKPRLLGTLAVERADALIAALNGENQADA